LITIQEPAHQRAGIIGGCSRFLHLRADTLARPTSVLLRRQHSMPVAVNFRGMRGLCTWWPYLIPTVPIRDEEFMGLRYTGGGWSR
jgi:hypothetical protein